MQTLAEIIEAVRNGERPDYEDLRYAICAIEALAVFDQHALMRLAEAEQAGQKPVMTASAVWQWEESFRRHQRAAAVAPKAYVGWNNDPDNPEFRARRKTAQKIWSRVSRQEKKG